MHQRTWDADASRVLWWLLLLLLLRWLLLLQLLCCRALPLPAGGGAVTGADTVAIDCRYGPCKSSVSVMKISKRIREEKKTYRGLQTHLRLKSPIPIQQWPQRCMLVMVGDGCCVFGRTWWWEGGRTRETRDNEERKFEHALNKSRGYVEFPFVVDSCFPRSFSLPPPSSSKRTTTITTIAYKLGAAALRRLLDGNSPRYVSFFFLLFFY